MADRIEIPRGHFALGGIILLIAACAVLFFVGLGRRSIVSEEFRWAEVAREMRLSGDYLNPTINGQPYYDKPLLSYWFVVAASYLTGGVDELAPRLPAAISGCLAVLLVVSLATRLYDSSTGLLAGAVLATSFGFIFYARRASADMETTTGVLAAVWLYERLEAIKFRRWVLALWVVMAITSLTKGLLGFALPIAVFMVDGQWTAVHEAPSGRRYWPRLLLAAARGNRWLLNRWTILAVPLAALLYLAPFFASIWQSGSEEGLNLVFRENLKRFWNPHNHKGPIYLYFGVIFVLAAPWSVMLPAALVPLRDSSRADRLARSYFLAIFAIFTLAASRRSYYLLPILPAASILIARVYRCPNDLLHPAALLLRKAGMGLFLMLVACAGVLLVPPASVLPHPYDALPELPWRWLFATGWIIAIMGLIWVALRQRGITCYMVGCAFAMQVYFFLFALPSTEQFRTRPEFLAQVRECLADDRSGLALCDARDVIFDLRLQPPIPEYMTADAADDALKSGQARWIISPSHRWPVVRHPLSIVAKERTQPWENTADRDHKLILLTVASTPASE